MYQNLFETWQTLARDELTVLPNGQFNLLKTETWDIYAECMSLHLSFLDEAETLDTLQGYIQRCIEDRDWLLFVTNTASYSAIEIQVSSIRFKAGGLKADTTIPQNLLTAYLTALAAQRSPNPGAWLHFKGGTVFVVAKASYSGQKIDSSSFAEKYSVEESPESKLQLRLIPGSEDRWIYNASKDYGDRIFYRDISDCWAREASVFLSLVGTEHPEHEGKLRFTEVPHAQA